MLPLETGYHKEGQVDDANATKLDANNSGEYEVEAIWDSAIYARDSESGHLSGFYYLVSWQRKRISGNYP